MKLMDPLETLLFDLNVDIRIYKDMRMAIDNKAQLSDHDLGALRVLNLVIDNLTFATECYKKGL